jgi:hypothetical protein
MTCKTCCWWIPDDSTELWKPPHCEEFDVPVKSCSCPKMFFGYNHDHASIPSDGVLIENDEGWGWRTGPDFGCIHYVCGAKTYEVPQ